MNATVKLENGLLTAAVRCFAELLRRSAQDDRTWSVVNQGVSRLGLLEIIIEREVQPPSLPEFDGERLQSDRKYRAWAIKQLRQPIPQDWWRATIPLDRAQLSNESYLNKMAGILGLGFARKLTPHDLPSFVAHSHEAVVVLGQMNPEFLQECLLRLKRHQLNAPYVCRYITTKMVHEELQRKLEALITVPDWFEERLDAAFARINADTAEKFAAINRRIDARVAAYQAQASDRCDALIKFQNTA